MRMWWISIGIITYLLSTGCDKVVSEPNVPTISAREIYGLIDSTRYHMDVTERPDRVLYFLQLLHSHQNASAEIALRYRGLLTDLAWNSGNYQDIISIAYGSLFKLAVRGENRVGTDASMLMMSAHALKRLGDTLSAIKLYQMLADTEYLAMRRGAQANLLTLYSKLGQHQRAVALAQILEQTEMMNPTDLSAHVNREYYWGRSLFLLGDRRNGEAHLRNVVSFMNNLRPNTHQTELRVRILTARSILRDWFMTSTSSNALKALSSCLRESIAIDVAMLQDALS